MLKILSKVSEKLKSQKAKNAIKVAERLAKKAQILKNKAEAISSGKKIVKPVVKVATAPKAVKQVSAAPVNIQASVKQIKNSVFIKTASKSISLFYANFKSIQDMLKKDKALISGSTFAPVKGEIVRERGAVERNMGLINSLAALNFFVVFKEVKAQEQLMSKFPGKFLTNKSERAKYEQLKLELDELQKSIYAIYRSRHIESAFNDKMNSIIEQSKVFSDVTKLLK
jgi:hypothetical protein